MSFYEVHEFVSHVYKGLFDIEIDKTTEAEFRGSLEVARTHFRNAINAGIRAVESDPDTIHAELLEGLGHKPHLHSL